MILGARIFSGNPYDGHTMHEQIEQCAILMQGLGVKPEVVYAHLGYRGVDKDNPGIQIKHRGKDKRLTDEERRLLKRRQAIEPTIGHHKADHPMNSCHLKGSEGDTLHAVLCAAGYFHPLVAADDRQERQGPFVVPAAGERFDGLICEIGKNHRHQPTAKVRSTLGAGLK